MDQQSGDIVVPWKLACLLFRPHIIQRALMQGKGVTEINDMLERGRRGEVVDELRTMLDQIINESANQAIVRTDYTRTEPTKIGGLMIGPSSPLYGARTFSQATEKLLSDLSEEEITDMKLQAKVAGGYMASRMAKAHLPKE